MGINDMEKRNSWYGIDNQVKIDISKSEKLVASKIIYLHWPPNNQPRGIHITSSIDRGLMFIEEHGSISTHFNSTS